MPMVGCSETSGDGGSGGSAGTGATGGSGGAGGTGGGGGTGGTILCDEDWECLDPNDCVTWSCEDGMCVYGNEPREKICDLGDGVHHGLCDGAGTCLECHQDAHCDDFNDCTSGSCSDGACNHTSLADGTPCAGGTCEVGRCVLSSKVLPCTEQGIRNAVAAGGGPYTFDCDGRATVFIKAEIVIERNVILDGEGNLTVDGSKAEFVPGGAEFPGPVFRVRSLRGEGGTSELRGFAVTNGREGIVASPRFPGGDTLTLVDSTVSGNSGSGIRNFGSTLIVVNATVSGNSGNGIRNGGTLMLINSTVSGNSAGEEGWPWGGGISGWGEMTLVNSTVSGNSAVDGGGIAIACDIDLGATLTLVHSTVSGNVASGEGSAISNSNCGMTLTVTNSLIDGDCSGDITSGGDNIESPGDTCGFEQGTDLVNITEGQLDLGPLQDNDGPTMTHALGADSVAIDHIPAVDCEVDEDQRGEPRPETDGDACDVGAFERQPEDP